jgi:hypothetical protein
MASSGYQARAARLGKSEKHSLEQLEVYQHLVGETHELGGIVRPGPRVFLEHDRVLGRAHEFGHETMDDDIPGREAAVIVAVEGKMGDVEGIMARLAVVMVDDAGRHVFQVVLFMDAFLDSSLALSNRLVCTLGPQLPSGSDVEWSPVVLTVEYFYVVYSQYWVRLAAVDNKR